MYILHRIHLGIQNILHTNISSQENLKKTARFMASLFSINLYSHRTENRANIDVSKWNKVGHDENVNAPFMNLTAQNLSPSAMLRGA